jgi:hypothetical protein
MLQIRFAPRPRLPVRLLHKLEFVIEAVEGTGHTAWAPLYFMMVTMAWTMVFHIAPFMPQQMLIRLFTQAGGTLRITA